jgi:hypothetical protein
VPLTAAFCCDAYLGYSTSTLEAERDRIVKAGITIAEDISYKDGQRHVARAGRRAQFEP